MIGKSVSFLAGHKILVYTLFVLITVATLMLTLLPPRHISDSALFQYDKLGHFLMFFGWTFMLGFSLMIRKRKLAPLLGIFLTGTLFGISIEIIQELMPFGRTASFWDAVADAAGSFTAVILLWAIQSRYEAYLKPILSKNTIERRNTLDS